MTDLILCITANACRTYIIKRFIDTLAGKSGRNRVQEFCAYGCFFLLTLGVYLAFHTSWCNFLANIFGMFALVGFYKKPVKDKIFIVGVTYLLLLGCDIVGVWLFVDYADGENFNQVYSILSVFLGCICELITEKIVQKRRNADTTQSFSLIVVPICSIALLLLVYYFEKETMPLVIIGVGLLLINFILLYLYNALCEAMVQNYENQILRQQAEAYANRLEVILQSEKKVRALRHDLKHHLGEIQYLAKNEKAKELDAYIRRMLEELQEPKENVPPDRSTGNTTA